MVSFLRKKILNSLLKILKKIRIISIISNCIGISNNSISISISIISISIISSSSVVIVVLTFFIIPLVTQFLYHPYLKNNIIINIKNVELLL